MITLFKNKFLIEINYNSGISKQFWVYNFKIDNGEYTWSSATHGNRPVMINPNSIESVWQLKIKTNVFTLIKGLILQ